ncbi:protein of unknown function [Taphrina deformans PYCC 5710]|uniref:Rho-GAP domain-containing protein n=1 Tax=Taphrina deformans (strain PYCC 5710 / ATCC 11124 / CBS 356.35 / IMI 108563 / JCM 9778 / NBRC 8474) TaxID=1097556 RepID=R4XFB0_TAPDE|nr:protein of unknown function [Taphrina deformans PYCC 5710]|eukprot:CCG84466.1 protein of unknown function [Taphrina deformans PYCC 5710]
MTGQVSIHNAEKTLDSVLKHDQAPVPNLVVTCCEAIEKWGLDVEGIYRLSAPTSAMDALRHTLLAGDMNTFSDKSMDVHAMACIVKQFFRELPDHLIPRDHQQIFLTATKLEQDEHERRIAVHQAVNDLPDANYSTLRYLIFHLRKIELHAAKNLMTASNLAIIFG